jgi:S1-C subfamily serine protease
MLRKALTAALASLFLFSFSATSGDLPPDVLEHVFQLHEQVLNTTVKITNANHGNGSGTVISKKLILTNNHVSRHFTDGIIPFEAKLRKGREVLHFKATAKVIANDEARDLALLEIVDNEWPGEVAQFAPAQIEFFPGETVFICGSPLGIDPFITQGLVALTSYNDENDILVTATALPGSSGGGLFIKRGGRYIQLGVVQAIPGMPPLYSMVPVIIPVIGQASAIPSKTVRAFLAEKGVELP